jgi:hypothetical protein
MTKTEYRRQWSAANPEKVQASRSRAYEKQQTDPRAFLSKVYNSMKQGAKMRGIELKLTKADVDKLLGESKGFCAMSGVKLTMRCNDLNRASIDRIDSSKGYLKTNVQVVSTQVNLAMNNHNKSDFIAMCVAVARKNKGN